MVTSIQLNKKELKQAREKEGSIAVKIEGDNSITVGRHFDDTNQLVSIISRDSIDALKQYFMDEMTKDDWKVVI